MEEASVWTSGAIKTLPRLIAISYAFMQLSFTKQGTKTKTVHKLPKWRGSTPPKRLSTGMMISELRNQIWGLGFGTSILLRDNEETKESVSICIKFGWKQDLSNSGFPVSLVISTCA